MADAAADGEEAQLVSLWDLMSLLTRGAALGASWAVTKSARIGLLDTAIALAFALCVAVCCVWFIRRVGDFVTERLGLRSGDFVESKQTNFVLKWLYAFGLVWIVLSSVITSELTACFIRHFLKAAEVADRL